MMSAPVIVIVDPYSAGAYLAKRLTAAGACVLAVESTPQLPANVRSRFAPTSVARRFAHDGDFHATLNQIRRWRPTRVVPGFESGVELADLLADALELPGNHPAQSAARRDKYLMGKAVAAKGLRTPRQMIVNRVEQLPAMLQSWSEWPLIAKPTRSAGSDHVMLCHTADEVQHACKSILGGKNLTGEENRQALLQVYQEGVEYVVDTVAWMGHIYVTAIWRYERPPEAQRWVCYDTMHLLPMSGELQCELIRFAVRVQQSLGIEFGPAHCEIMWTAKGPTLIEIGARMTGGINAMLVDHCGGISQLTATVDYLLAPERLEERLSTPQELQRYALNHFLRPARLGTLRRTRFLDCIETLPSFHSQSVASQPGTTLSEVSGIVTLVHESPAVLNEDLARIRAWEREGMFEIDESTEAGGPLGEALS